MAAACVWHAFTSRCRTSLVVTMKPEGCERAPERQAAAPLNFKTPLCPSRFVRQPRAACAAQPELPHLVWLQAAFCLSCTWSLQRSNGCLGGRVLLGARSTEWLAF